MTSRITLAGIILFACALLAGAPAQAQPMKCSGEEKTCIVNCSKAARTTLSVCLTACGVRKSACMRSGCWDNGAQRYCGLAKQ